VENEAPEKARISIPALALRRPITVLMIFAAVFVLGVVAMYRMQLEFLPNVSRPVLSVSAYYPNAIPSEVEKVIAIPAEDELRSVRHLHEIRSTSYRDRCSLRLEFDWETDMGLAFLEVKDRLDRLEAGMPDEVSEFSIWKSSTTDVPVLFMDLSWDKPVEELYDLAERRLLPALERLDGVARVDLWGRESKRIYVDLDQERLKLHNITPYQLISTLKAHNLNLSSGKIIEDGTEYFLRSINEYSSVEEIRNIIVGPNALRLKEVASVRYDYPKRSGIARLDGREALVMAIIKESMANTIEVSDRVKEELDAIMAEPDLRDAEYLIFFDQAKEILHTFDTLTSTGKWGGLLAILVLVFFLRRMRPTLIISAVIPLSILVAVTALYFVANGLNILSMLGLMLAIGMLVDNSIVVVENMFHEFEKGRPREEAASHGASEVALAITASTLTTIIVFAPLVFMERGEVQIFTQEIGVAISLALLASLAISMTLTPLATSRLLVKGGIARPRMIIWLTGRYRSALDWSLSHGWSMLLIIIVVCTVSYSVPYKSIKARGNPPSEARRGRIEIEMLKGQDLEAATDIFKEIEGILLSRKEELEIDYIFSFTSFYSSRNRIMIKFTEPEEAILDTAELAKKIKALMPEFAEAKVHVSNVEMEGSSSEVSLRLKGEDTALLRSLADDLCEEIRELDSVISAEADVEAGLDEIHVTVNEDATSKRGISPAAVAETLAFALKGTSLPELKTGEKEIDVYVQLEEVDRENLHQLRNLQIQTIDGGTIPLGTVASFQKERGLDAIRRSGGKHLVRIKVSTDKEALTVIRGKLDKIAANFALPTGYTIEYGHEIREFIKNQRMVGMAMMFSLVLIYIVLGTLFESFIQPLCILLSVPLAFVGTYWVMYLSDTPMDNAANVGLILLIGIVVNNAIVIVDHINNLRRSGMSRREAILQGGVDRFRPVVMTAVTTIVGGLPMAIGGQTLFGGEFMFAPMARAIAGGLASATFLTLFVIPQFYAYFDSIQQLLGRLAAAVTQRKAPAFTLE
jgi:HAE1 family hydrophobic/amphiphilic exporter-1